MTDESFTTIQPGDQLSIVANLDVLWMPYSALFGELLPGEFSPDQTPFRVGFEVEVKGE
jgi:hypothetical protein